MEHVLSTFKMKKRRKSISDYAILAVLTLFALIELFPVYNALVISFTTQVSYAQNPFQLWPGQFTTEAYDFVLNSDALWSGYKVTLFLLVAGVAINMFLTCTMAFALSRKSFAGKNLIMNMIIVTMYFTGGIVPLYLLVSTLGGINHLWSMIFPVAMNTFNMLIVRNYFANLPDALEESARIDGAGLFTIFSRIILPLSKPVLATISLFYAVDRWNEWYFGMLFIQQQSKQPLQLVLRSIIMSINTLSNSYAQLMNVEVPKFQMSVKLASVFFVMLPITLIYPFVQRYFVKGIMIGAIKG